MKANSTFASFIVKTGIRNSVHRLETNFTDFEKVKASHTRLLSVRHDHSRRVDLEKAVWENNADVLVDQKGDLAVAIDFRLNHPTATKPKFLAMIDQYRSYLPKDLLTFDPEYLKFYMGEVKVRSQLIFDHAMLKKIFDPSMTSASVCGAFKSNLGSACESQFFEAYQIARADFQTLEQYGYQSQDRVLKNFARFFLIESDFSSIEFAKAVVGESKLIQAGSLESSLEAFPGHNDSLKLTTEESKLKDFKAGVGFHAEMFSDDIQAAVDSLFFAPMNGFGVKRKTTKASLRQSLDQ